MRPGVKAFVLALLVCVPAALSAQDLPPLGTPSTPPPDLTEIEPDPEPEPEPELELDPENPAAPAADSSEEEASAEAPAAAAKKKITTKPQAEEDERDPRLVSPGLNTEGSIGMQRMAAAWGGVPKTLQVALLGEFYSGRNAVRFNDSDTLFVGNLVIEATPIEYFSANLRLKTRNNVNTFGRPQAMLSQGDLLIGLKGSYPLGDGLWIGGDLSLDFPTDFGSAGLRFAGTSVRPRLLFSFDGNGLDANIPLKGHINVGYRVDNTPNLIPDGVEVTRVERFAYELSAYDFVELGLGFMYDLPYVSPFLSWNLAAPVAPAEGTCGQANLPCVADAGFGSFPNVISLGLKSEPIDHLGLHLGVDFGLTSRDAAGLPVTPPYMIVFGAGWTIDPRPKIEYVEVEREVPAQTPQRIIVGKLLDKETGEPIPGAIVRYGGTETPQATDEQGVFRSYGFVPASALALSFAHPDYETLKLDVTLETGEGEQEATIELTPAVKSGTIMGRVEDETGVAVPNIRVKLSGPDIYEPLPTSDGRFEEKVEAGSYTVAVSAPGFLTRGQDVTVDAEGTVDLVVTLRPAPQEKVVTLREDKIEIQEKIFFETGKATILPQSFNVLDQVASLLTENPQIKQLQVEGHTDDIGADELNLELSQTRAESVRAYLMENGVGSSRLIAKGFGETRPILPNTSKRNRSFNRRVEFNIVKQ